MNHIFYTKGSEVLELDATGICGADSISKLERGLNKFKGSRSVTKYFWTTNFSQSRKRFFLYSSVRYFDGLSLRHCCWSDFCNRQSAVYVHLLKLLSLLTPVWVGSKNHNQLYKTIKGGEFGNQVGKLEQHKDDCWADVLYLGPRLQQSLNCCVRIVCTLLCWQPYFRTESSNYYGSYDICLQKFPEVKKLEAWRVLGWNISHGCPLGFPWLLFWKDIGLGRPLIWVSMAVPALTSHPAIICILTTATEHLNINFIMKSTDLLNQTRADHIPLHQSAPSIGGVKNLIFWSILWKRMFMCKPH